MDRATFVLVAKFAGVGFLALGATLLVSFLAWFLLAIDGNPLFVYGFLATAIGLLFAFPHRANPALWFTWTLADAERRREERGRPSSAMTTPAGP